MSNTEGILVIVCRQLRTYDGGMSTRLRSDPALTAAIERAREVAEASGELQARPGLSTAPSLPAEAESIVAAWIRDGGYSRAVAVIAASDPDLADQ